MPETFIPTHDWLYQHIVEDSCVAVVCADAAGVVRLWNKGAEDIFGWTADETLGRSMDFMIPEKQRPSHWEGYHEVMKTGVTKYGRSVLAVPALTKDGRRISIEFNVVLLKAPDGGGVVGIAAILQDVTQRWGRDKELRKRLAAAEGRMPRTGSAS